MFFDCHTHSANSDGKCSVDELCLKAVEKSLGGIIITDHANMNYYNERNTYQSIKNSIKDRGFWNLYMIKSYILKILLQAEL